MNLNPREGECWSLGDNQMGHLLLHFPVCILKSGCRKHSTSRNLLNIWSEGLFFSLSLKHQDRQKYQLANHVFSTLKICWESEHFPLFTLVWDLSPLTWWPWLSPILGSPPLPGSLQCVLTIVACIILLNESQIWSPLLSEPSNGSFYSEWNQKPLKDRRFYHNPPSRILFLLLFCSTLASCLLSLEGSRPTIQVAHPSLPSSLCSVSPSQTCLF